MPESTKPSAFDGAPSLDELPLLERLAAFEVLAGVAPAALHGLVSACTLRNVAVGDCLLAKGEMNQTMYFILAGRFEVVLDDDAEPIAHLEAGHTVGEMSLLDGRPTSAMVRAAEASRVLIIDEMAFWRLVHASHEFTIHLLVQLAARLRANNSALLDGVRKMQRLERDVWVDALTGAFNRRWLEERLPRFLQRFLRSGEPLSVFLLDVDHFKRVNDTYGHLVGDHVLVEVARACMARLRPTDMVARYGGEEFVVILPNTSLVGAIAAAERLRSSIAALRAMRDDSELPSVTVSIGLASVRVDDKPATLLGRADEALYRAKSGGRNRVECER